MSSTIRIANWDIALVGWASMLIGEDFRWGETDCVTVLRAGLAVMYGAPVGPEIDPMYTTREEAEAALEEWGDVVTNLTTLGATEEDVNFAQSGDVLIFPLGEGEITNGAALVLGAEQALVVTEAQGIRIVPLEVIREVGEVTVYRLPWELTTGAYDREVVEGALSGQRAAGGFLVEDDTLTETATGADLMDAEFGLEE